MLDREFLDALAAVNLPEDSDPSFPRMSASLLDSWRYSGIPEWVFRGVTAAYHSRRLDTIATGPDRHVRFARWFATPRNFMKVRRLAHRQYRVIRREELSRRIVTLQSEIQQTRKELATYGG